MALRGPLVVDPGDALVPVPQLFHQALNGFAVTWDSCFREGPLESWLDMDRKFLCVPNHSVLEDIFIDAVREEFLLYREKGEILDSWKPLTCFSLAITLWLKL